MSFNYLPGVQTQTLDGGLAAVAVPQTKSTLILGVSNKGPADQVVQITNRATVAPMFGTQGNILQSVEELAVFCDNLYVYRMGAQKATLTGVGTSTGASPQAGFDITFGQAESDAGTIYRVWYDAGVLYIYLNGNVVYSNDPANPVDTLDCSVSGSSTGGLQLGTGASATYASAIPVNTMPVGDATDPAPVFTNAVDGTQLTGRQLFIAMKKALDLLAIYPIQQVYCPTARLDQPNVAFYVSTDSTTAAHNPATNPDALDWLQTITGPGRLPLYKWASDTVDSEGNTKNPITDVAYTAMGAVADPTARLAAGYHEVNYGYELAKFAETQSEINGGCLAFLGCTGPAGNSFRLRDLLNWVGFLPGYDPVTGRPTAPGSGLKGIPYMTGTTAAKLNLLCSDKANGYRTPGFYKTDSGEYDGGAQTDRNGHPIDIGAYLHVVGDYGLLANGYGNYVANLAGYVAGYTSALDEKNSPTNKQVVSVSQLYVIGSDHLDDLTKAKINMLRYKKLNQPAVLLHGMTAAHDASDYTNLVRMRVKFLVVTTLNNVADQYIGEATTDGLTMQAMQTTLDTALLDLQKRGYIGKYSFNVYATAADQRIGHANIDITFQPANELVQLNATVAVSR